MKLNYRLQNAQQPTHALPIVLIHGLFGNLDNLGILARDLQKQHDVIQVDLRNHGLSPRTSEMNYPAMAGDVKALLDALSIDNAIIIEHSMGGKTAMALSAQIPDRIEKIVAIDIAPVDYQLRRHNDVFAALRAVTAAGVTTRTEVAAIMRHHLREEGVVQFLLKSFQQGEWRFNVAVRHPLNLDDRYRETLLQQFPNAKAHVIAGSGHWVHAEKPDAVLRAIHRFLEEPPA
ncbi:MULTISPECIES: alpha/beta fold hydrolase [Symbiopectobacterium]|uniref:alpha/beta fold hydrolase n=1 Tax=Symbiopectobacterium TaxID=801 RepID=UPI001A31BCB3|nr:MULTISPECIES: alpha/beta fold hydrolase [Symbiopectobacterium]MBG6247558.1 alpha/beta fold hydrolase [Candidatus Symbiopectobacterium sp. PLON1]MBT9429676.1 alpha/beta fold hydrolase [Candidatus Symbiopectobacterium endolongispinus]